MILDFQKLTTHFYRGGRSLSLACGCFDVLTVGHVRHLQAAKRLCSSLCVLVTADRHVNKGPGRPVVPEAQRAEVVDALGCVDFVIVNPHPTAVEVIRCLRPEVYVKGREYRDMPAGWPIAKQLQSEVEAVESVGGRIEFTDTEELHTTDVVASLRCS